MKRQIAAIYVRKSNDQKNVAEDQKSVERQIALAMAFAISKDYHVPKHLVFIDDAVSGGEVRKLVGKQQLLNAISRIDREFNVLIMRDRSRFSRRDGDESFSECKRIARMGVTIWFYQSASTFKHGTFADNVMGMVEGEMHAEYRRSTGRNIRDANTLKAAAGHHVNGKVYGYDNHTVFIGGKRSHVILIVNKEQATIVVFIFKRACDGAGYSKIAKELNAKGVPPPRSKRGQWNQAGVQAILNRHLYYGVRYRNKSTFIETDEGKKFQRLSPSQWITVPAQCEPIITEATFRMAAKQRERRLAKLAGLPRGGRQRDHVSKYLLIGFARCAICEGPIATRSYHVGPDGQLYATKEKGTTLQRFYTCLTYHKHGPKACTNATTSPILETDKQVKAAIVNALTDPSFKKNVLAERDRRQKANANAATLKQLRADLATIDTEVERLVKLIVAGRGGVAVAKAAEERQAKAATLRDQLAAIDKQATGGGESTAAFTKRLDDETHGVRQLKGHDIDAWRNLVARVVDGPIMLTPKPLPEHAARKNARRFEFEGKFAYEELFFVGFTTTNASFKTSSSGWKQTFKGTAA